MNHVKHICFFRYIFCNYHRASIPSPDLFANLHHHFPKQDSPSYRKSPRASVGALMLCIRQVTATRRCTRACWPLSGRWKPWISKTALPGLAGPVRLLMLDQLSDPRNVGAIMRSALALGAQAIITTHRNAPEESGALARAAAGALERVPMIRVVNLARAVERLQEDGIEIAGLAADGDSDVGSLREIERLGIVMGAEGTGLRHLTRRHCDRLVRINISEDSESLNVSIAAAIALYAARLD